LIAIEDPDIAAGMLLGMLAFELQRAIMFGQKPPPGRQEVRHWAQVCAALFLEGARNSNIRRTQPALDAES
jgi:AefR-like transcriptional repressor, C-terminal domain